MTRYFLKLDYNGSAFHGWQIQPNGITVQEWINKTLTNLLHEPINVVGCGRTDTGVHAKNYMAHFDTQTPNLNTDSQFLHKLNRYLPKEIHVLEIIAVHNDAHARFDAVSRTYKYYISLKKEPFYFMFHAPVHGTIDVDLMNKASKLLFAYTDFTSFSKADTDTKTNNCKIMEAYWENIDHSLVFTITADRFLRNMVRAIVGTLLEVGKHKTTLAEFAQIIESKDRSKAGTSVPAQGLFLMDVQYSYL